jgi:hypothetical protein
MAPVAERPGKKGRRQKPSAGSSRRAARPPASGRRGPAARKGAAPTSQRKAPASLARPASRPKVQLPPPQATPPPAAPAGLTEEQRIESAKYLSSAAPRRLFEEERFLFPESYGVSRVRLLVKDPYWLFAHWDVASKAHRELRATQGERSAALATLTLRVTDPVSGGLTTILLPKGARAWYVRTDGAARAYRAELGLTLPSGEFRHLAWSNTVQTPRVGPSRRPARHVVRFGESSLPPEEAVAEARAGERATRPWAGSRAASKDGPAPERDYAPEGFGAAEDPPVPGGASDVFNRGGASDVHRR